MADTTYLATWWSIFFAIGIINLPLTWLIFRKFIDRGYGLSKTIGFLLSSFPVYLVSTTRIFAFTTALISISLAILFLVNIYILFIYKKVIFISLRKSLRVILLQEIIFTAGLLLWSYVRGHNPDINGLEKFMDYGFINSILRTEYLPAPDMWFAGETINYYWYGHYWSAFITKLSHIPSAVTYNLMLATILGLGLTQAFSISGTLIASLKEKFDKRTAYAAGIISAVILIFAGNFHTPIYALKEGKDQYWYPDATRFIGYNPDTNDKTIHEFPLYSFVVADLHAHLLNFPFVLLYIALLLRVATKKKRSLPDYLMSGLVLGIMFMTSAWDFANYSMTTGITMLLFAIRKNGLKLLSFIEAVVNTAPVVFFGLVVTVPFLIKFDSIAQGVSTVNAHTPLWQLLVLWGFPAVLAAVLSLIIVKIRPRIKSTDVFAGSLFISSLILIVLPEIIYVKDIYIASHHRANTMFKLTYQSFVMSYLLSGYVAVRSLLLIKRMYLKFLVFIFFAAIFASILWYPSFAVNSYYADLKEYKGLSGETWLKERYPELYSVVLFMRENVEGQPVILEAPGDSYTEHNVVSSYTGLPTVSGWFVHEWLWRGNASFPQGRVDEITQIYTSGDLELTKKLMKKYRIAYVLVGAFEYEKFPGLNESIFKDLGRIVFSQGNTKLYQMKNF